MHLHPTLRNILLVAISALVALVLAELAVRTLIPEAVPAGPRSVDELDRQEALGFVFAPGTPIAGSLNGEKYDDLGFINDRVLPRYDIVALGDSHTAGGYGNRWPPALAATSGLSVYNMGVPGYGIAQYKYLLERALEFDPKVVVIGLYLGNDIFDTYDTVYHLPYWKQYRSPDFVDDSPLRVADLDKVDVRFKGLRDWVRRRVVLYALLSESTRNLREWLGLATPRYTGTTDWATATFDAGLRYDGVPSQETVFWVGFRRSGLDLNNKNIEEGLRLSSRFLVEMAAQARSASSTLVVAILPTKERVYYDRVRQQADTNALYRGNVVYEDKIRASILDVCTESRILCLDILPVMQEALDAGEVIYPHSWDDHPNARGYDIYAEGIFDGLQRLGVIPSS